MLTILVLVRVNANPYFGPFWPPMGWPLVANLVLGHWAPLACTACTLPSAWPKVGAKGFRQQKCKLAAKKGQKGRLCTSFAILNVFVCMSLITATFFFRLIFGGWAVPLAHPVCIVPLALGSWPNLHFFLLKKASWARGPGHSTLQHGNRQAS